MRMTILALAWSCVAGAAVAHDLGARAPVKSAQIDVVNLPSPERQGGDTILNATVISGDLPYNDSGTTAGHTDDYDEVCPYTQSTAADVVYSYTPAYAVDVDIDLCGSGYDTKLYVYDSDLNVVACNDDYYTGDPCGAYVSKLENVILLAGETYYLIIDGYGSDYGDYVLDMSENVPCVVECPAYSYPEGEPPLDYDYVDNWNGGCNTLGVPFQHLSGDGSGECVLCGVSGWYLFQGSNFRDTDWLCLTMGPQGQWGQIEIVGEAEYATYLFELGPHDCNVVDIVQQVELQPCVEGTMAITGYSSHEVVWLWAGPTVFAPPSGSAPQMYDYVLWISGLFPPVATDATSWSTVKALFD